MGKFSMQTFCGFIVSNRSFCSRNEQTDVMSFSSGLYTCLPFIALIVPTDSLEAAPIFMWSAILFVLRWRTLSEIAATVIERIVIPVIAILIHGAIKNNSVHVNHRIFTAHSIKTFRMRAPKRTPVPLRESCKIFCVHKGILISGQGNKFVRFVQRLSDCVSSHAVLWHRFTSNELLRSTAIL